METSKKPTLILFIQFIIKVSIYIQIIFLALFTLNAVSESFGWTTSNKESEVLDVRVTQGKLILVNTVVDGKMSKFAHLNLSSGTLSFEKSKDRGFTLLKLIFGWIGYAITISITFLLTKVFKNVVVERPFVPENALYLKIIALLIMASSVVTFIQDLIINGFLKENFLLEGSQIRSHLTIDVKTIFAGLIILIIAQIFRTGTNLKEEHDLTV